MILNSDYPLIFYIKNVVKFFKIGQLFSFSFFFFLLLNLPVDLTKWNKCQMLHFPSLAYEFGCW